MKSTTRRRAPEFTATQLNKVEPCGAGLVRLHFSVERAAAWDTQVTILMPCAAVDGTLGFAVQAARAIASEIDGAAEQVEHRGTVN
ncbi:hypothetical protein IQ16_01926 [Bradyrhizobium huanghuaihaiense]|uniref:Uncharacterized protein n=1 Tax=Bradyrhizobium huanghuaihaiense TaxID=990078 RepID=A0A562RXK5_9BRAD|nr:hypothetical protein [Bradyrhizobium huanghuaihaiense]TWI73782.1 hypothetical protein IQ16_01926 [Bradyrhizobium huanghuaihaiense]